MKQFKYEAPISMFTKKHYCPNCSSLLQVKKVTKTVNSESEEAKDYDFTTDCELGSGVLVGDVDFIGYRYHCENCGMEMTNKDMRKHEYAKKWGEGKERKSTGKVGFMLFISISLALLLVYAYILK